MAEQDKLDPLWQVKLQPDLDFSWFLITEKQVGDLTLWGTFSPLSPAGRVCLGEGCP